MRMGPIVAIGASAGGVEALAALFSALRGALSAPVLVVLHVPHDGVSRLPGILGKSTRMPVSHAKHDELLAAGHVYVAPPDRHLLIRDGRILLTVGPRENGHRPAIDPTFRSVAEQSGAQAIGVVLSGTRDDGTQGLLRIKNAGGVALAQDPKEAIFAWMPRSAIEHVLVDRSAPVAQLAHEIESRFAKGPPIGLNATREVSMASRSAHEAKDTDEHTTSRRGAEVLRCPDCGGVMKEQVEGQIDRYVCRVGHASTAETLFVQQGAAIEQALWAATNALEERAALARRMAARPNARTLDVQRYTERAAELDRQAAVIRQLLLGRAAVEDRNPEQDS